MSEVDRIIDKHTLLRGADTTMLDGITYCCNLDGRLAQAIKEYYLSLLPEKNYTIGYGEEWNDCIDDMRKRIEGAE